MVKEVYGKIVRSKILIFLVQFIILTLFIYGFNYVYQIDFDASISEERKMIIQFLANFIQFKDLDSFLFVNGFWILVSFIPIIIFREIRPALIANLKLIFFLNFFFYVFLSRYSPIFFNNEVWGLMLNTVIITIIIGLISIVFSFIAKKLTEPNIDAQLADLEKVIQTTRYVCPNCGTEYNSVPKYCYKCSIELIHDNGKNKTENTN
ncbi:MAG: hypothetical protein R6W84_16220 [Promethearchaeia archaeon]